MVLLMKSAEEQRTKSYERPIKSHCTYLVKGRRTNHKVDCLVRNIKRWWHRVSKSKFTGVAAEF